MDIPTLSDRKMNAWHRRDVQMSRRDVQMSRLCLSEKLECVLEVVVVADRGLVG